MHLTHLIIDEFLADPLLIREAALALDYPQPSEPPYFPGRNASHVLEVQHMDEVVSSLVGEPLEAVPQTSHLRPRLALEGDTGRGGVHVDQCHWSGIIYLTPDEICRGGTSFYRHKRTDTERAPVFPEDLVKMGYSHPTEVWDDVVNPDTNRPECWDTTLTVPMRFNRLVLFRAYLWHNAGASFGDSPETGRLILPLFYQPKR